MNIHKELQERCGLADVSRIAKSLHDSYQPFLLDCQVWDLLQRTVPVSVYVDLFLPLKKEIVGHKLINDIVMNTYFGERKVKYHLTQKYINRTDEVALFEFNVGSSRLDFARINGNSYAYEIKTELDSLDKLEKQIMDYSAVFEYIHVVCHPDHYQKVLTKVPEYCGIITYNTTKADFPFIFRRKRLKCPEISSQAQLSALTSKELERILKTEVISGMDLERKGREEQILSNLNGTKINHHFKEAVKSRFRKRWQFVCEHIEHIEPIDIQPFFKSTADPYWVYYKNSSMV